MEAMLRLAPNPRIPCPLAWRSDRLVAVAKPAGVVCEPGIGHVDDSLLNGLAVEFGAALDALGEARDFGLLHRLDKDTSGLVLVALDAGAYDALRAQFEARAIRKTYLALVEGAPRTERGTIALPIAEVRRGDMKIAVVDRARRGDEAVTRYRVLARGGRRTLLQVEPVTGRLHQVRLHLSQIGCPVVNDRVYRVDLPPNTSAPPRGRAVPPLALHAWSLAFRAPAAGPAAAVPMRAERRAGRDAPAGEPVTVLAPIPEAFTALLAEARIPAPSAPRHADE
jgi:23S rRNA pseudouridine1911/1915/1917 synthase